MSIYTSTKLSASSQDDLELIWHYDNFTIDATVQK